MYEDLLLTGTNRFPVQGLSLEELAAEKLLAWSTKDLPKHLVDLAWIQREHPGVSHQRIAELVVEKFVREKHEHRYRVLKLDRVDGLDARVTDQRRLERHLLNGWNDVATQELFFLPHEERRDPTESLMVPDNVRDLGLGLWNHVREFLP